MQQIVVLGCGLVGAVIARELAAQKDLQVTVVDSNTEVLEGLRQRIGVRVRQSDLSSTPEIAQAVVDADTVVGALPGRLGFSMLETVIRAGKPIADISFSPEDPLSLDALARERGITAIVDCGVSPGLSNFAVGRAASEFDSVEEVTILVGGLPVNRARPYQYAIVFSATDVIEEYVRPARVIEDGQIVTRPALSQVESVEVPEIGVLEAFLTDGLRTLLTSISARFMREKTLRYPGHALQMQMLRDAGFFDSASVAVPVFGGEVSPRALSERLLSRAWALAEGEEEFTYLKVEVAGHREGRLRKRTFELLDRTDARSGTTSMARTTGFPCAVAAEMLARGEYAEPGVAAPERLARDSRASRLFLERLNARGLKWNEMTEEIG